MSTDVTQDNRLISITTPLEKDELMIVGIHGAEALGRLFEFELDLISLKGTIVPKDVLGQNVTIELIREDSNKRYINGHISRFGLVSVDESKKEDKKNIYTYRATLVPWLWFHTLYADCRIFQNMKVPDIIKKVFKDKGNTDISDKLTGTYRTWEYCVQYRETDFNFVSRLMENEGIYFFFSHKDGKHTLVLCDDDSAHDNIEGTSTLSYKKDKVKVEGEEAIWGWSKGHELATNHYVITDYNPLTPQADLKQEVDAAADKDWPSSTKYEVFDFPGSQTSSTDGRSYVVARMKELEAQYSIAHGTSDCRTVAAGGKFTLEGQPTGDDGDYLISAVSYQILGDDLGFGLGRLADRESFYECQITSIPAKTVFRSPRATPKPVVQGPQTAKITGPKGQEIYCDKYGRVKCQFYWDRQGKNDENSSCWIRVSQGHAGKSWGGIDIPRIGEEVIVEFLEGDPDRPIITGRVYNGTNMPPFTLPDKNMVSGLKSNSTPGGGGNNEISMDDSKGKELINIHGQYNMTTTVENDQTDSIKHNRTTTVTNDDAETVNGNQSITVAKDQSVTISGNQTQNISKKQTEQIGSDQALTVTGKQNYTIGGDQTHSISGKQSHTVGGDSTTSIGGKQSVTVGGDVAITSGGNVTITAAQKITLIAGPSSIILGPDGITISAGGMVKVLGAMIKHNG